MGAVCCTCGDLRPTAPQQAMLLHPCALLSGGRGPQVCPHTRRAVLYTCQWQVWSVSVGLDGVGSCPRWCAGGALPPGRGWAALRAWCTALQLMHALCMSQACPPRAVLWFWQVSGRCGAELRCMLGRPCAAGVAGQGGAAAGALPWSGSAQQCCVRGLLGLGSHVLRQPRLDGCWRSTVGCRRGPSDGGWWVGYRRGRASTEYATVIPSRTHRIPSELRS